MPVESAARWLARLDSGKRRVVLRTAILWTMPPGLAAVTFQVCIRFLYENGILR